MASGKSSLSRFVQGKEITTFGLHIVATPDTQNLARKIQNQIQGILDTARNNGSSSSRNEEVTIDIIDEYNQFECGESISTLGESVRGKHVYLLSDPSGDYESSNGVIRKNDLNAKLMHDLLLLGSIRDNGARTVNLVQSCIPYARQDKTTPEKRQSASIDNIGEWIANMTQRDGYCINIDLHNPASKSAFKGTNFINLYTGWFVEEAIKRSGLPRNNLTLSGADQGGAKTTEAIAKALELSHINVIKGRDYSVPNSVEEIQVFGDIEGKDVLIQDDMLDTGGTMERLIEEMIALKPRSINIAITHGMLNGKAIERLERLKEKYPEILGDIYITDSINKTDLPDFIKVISLDKILANTITGIYKGLGVDRGDNDNYALKGSISLGGVIGKTSDGVNILGQVPGRKLDRENIRTVVKSIKSKKTDEAT